MSDPSQETRKRAMQALYGVRAVEGPPGENGLRTVWHLGAAGAELLSLVDRDGRVQRQELTLLEDHCVWASGEGVRTGRVERGEGAPGGPASSVVQTDVELVPGRVLEVASALSSYEGQDRYILHIQRVLALAREGLELARIDATRAKPVAVAPEPPVVEAERPAEPLRFGQSLPNEVLPPVVRHSEGLVMLAVFGVATALTVVLLFWLL
ncbi:hypothetical protein JGU66_05065 [Myxococcaceae bacterium JPH2]|nr:hypothetical protein [Myxococcaceae bacterium JPH2]